MASKAETAPVEAYNIYLPTHAESGELIGVSLVETYEIGPSHEKPPLGARLQELEFLTGTAHLWEPVEHADTPRALTVKAAEGQKAVDEAAAAQEQAIKEAQDREQAERDAAAAAQEAAAKAAQERADAAQAAQDAQTRANEEAAAAALAASAKARIAQLLDPEGYAKAQAVAAIEAEHEELVPFADKDEAAQLDAVKEARIAALDNAE